MCYKQQTISICSDDTDHNADPGIFCEIEASSRMSHATPSMTITIFSCVGSSLRSNRRPTSFPIIYLHWLYSDLNSDDKLLLNEVSK